MKKIGVVCLPSSNSRSVFNSLRRIGREVNRVESESDLRFVTHLIVPGVSSFGTTINELKMMNLWDFFKNVKGSSVKILGLCAGMQIMGLGSQESPSVEGLGWFPYTCEPFLKESESLVFHTGWNSISSLRTSSALDFYHDHMYYFNHSYRIRLLDETFNFESHVISSFHGDFISGFQHENIAAVQFHPEKSQRAGTFLLESFLEW